MKRRSTRISPLGWLVAIALCGMVMLVMPRAGRQPSEAVPGPQTGKLPTDTAAAFTPVPSPTLILSVIERTITPLEAEVTGLVGVRTVRAVVSVDGIVYMEVDVLEGYAAQPFAEALLEVARRYGTVADFSVLLNDGVAVPTSFLWRNGGWNGVPMIQQATLVQATTQPQVPISLPTWTPLPYIPPAPTQPVVSPYTCNGVDDVNCGDFNRNWQQAQAHMLMCADEDNLDGDGDGRACEY